MLLSGLAVRPPMPVMQPFIAIPGVVAVIDSVLAGAIAGIVGLGLDLAIGWSLALGGLAFLVSMALFGLWARRTIAKYVAQLVVRFPSPERGAV